MSDYEDIIRKASTTQKERTRRERAIEDCLGEPIPRTLNHLLGEHGGSVRPALRSLNDKLEEEGMDAKVSSTTFYSWRSKYCLDEKDYSTYE